MAQDLCKYYKMQKFVSYNSGQTWIPLEEYQRGELYEAHSSDCGSGDFQYHWVLISDGYICDGKDRYTKEVYQYSEDGIVWYNVWPTMYRKGTLVERNSPFCDNAGNGQYTSGDTNPISGDPTCPPDYIWNGSECICNGPVDVHGFCHPCGECAIWNPTTLACEFNGGIVDGVCVYCGEHMHFDYVLNKCVCDKGWEFKPCNICARDRDDCYKRGGSDPLKIIKCADSNGILTSADTTYYENHWVILSYNVGDCIYRIDDNAFNGQTRMSSITISNSVEEVGNFAFANCESLTSIYFPSNITSLGFHAFNGCVKLDNIEFGGTIPTVIQPYMFDGCGIKSADFLNNGNIYIISDYSFNNCYRLSEVTLPNMLMYIGNYAFQYCNKLNNITVPNDVTYIGTKAFNYCNSMTIANINANDVTIGDSAFSNCTSLTAVTVQSSAVTMGNDVFNGCTSLLKITFTSPTPFTIGEHDFDNTNNCMLFVPCESEQAYKTAWPQYADRISCNDTGIYYRWTDTETRYCDGTDEYLGEKQEMTTDGIHWTDSGQYRATKLITHYSRYCGYQGEVGLTVTNDDGYTRYYEPCE